MATRRRAAVKKPAVQEVTNAGELRLHLGPDTIRAILQENGDFKVEFKTGFGSVWNEVTTGNIGSGVCAGCGGPHVRTKGE